MRHLKRFNENMEMNVGGLKCDNPSCDWNNMSISFDEYPNNGNGTETLASEDNISESLPRQHSVDQLKKLRKMTKGTDIGDRVSDMEKQGANIQYSRNVVDSGIESYEDFEKHNKKFVPSWNLKHLISPFTGEGKKKK